MLRAYEDDYAPDYRMIAAAEYRIDLSDGTVEAQPVNTVIYDAGTGEMDSEFGVFYKMRYGQEVSEVLGSPVQGGTCDWLLEHGEAFLSETD